VPDAEAYRVTRADRVLFDVPLLGYAIAWLMGPLGLLFLAVYAAFLVSVIVRPPGRPRAAAAGSDPSGPSSRVLTTAGLTLLVVIGAASGVALRHEGRPTWAAWTDTAVVSGTTLTAAAPPAPAAPTGVTCVPGTGNRVVFNWTALPGLTYVVHDVPSLTGVDLAVGVTSGPYSPQNNTKGTFWVTAVNGTSSSPPSVVYGYDKGACGSGS
jgi:hypothetical protein